MDLNTNNNNNVFQNRRTYFLQKLNYNLFKGYFKLARQLILDRRYDKNEIISEKRLAKLELVSEKVFLAGKTPLILCSFINDRKWRVSLARMLIENGSDIKFKNPFNGANALHYACLNLRFDLINLYLNTIDFNLNACDKHGNSAIICFLAALSAETKEVPRAGCLETLENFINTYKRYQMSLNIKNSLGITPLDICELIEIDSIKNKIKQLIIEHEEEFSPSTESTITDILAPLKVFRPQETINIQKASSRPSTNCSFLDEVINFNRIFNNQTTKPLDIDKDISITLMNKDLRYNSSTPIIRINHDSLRKQSNDSQNVSSLEKSIKTPRSQTPRKVKIDKTKFAIDLDENKKLSVDYNKSIDDKLYRIYMEKRGLVNSTSHFCTYDSTRASTNHLLSPKLNNKENSTKELRIYRNNDYQLLIDRNKNDSYKVISENNSNTCTINRKKTWRESYGDINRHFEIVSSMAYCKGFTPNHAVPVKLTHKAFNIKSNNTSSQQSDNVESTSVASSKLSRASSSHRKSRMPDRGHPSSSFKRF